MGNHSMRHYRTVLIWSVALVLSGCIFRQPVSTSYEIAPHKPAGFSISKTVMLVADNQLNHLYGDPMWMRSEMADKFVSVAIRPVQQDLFAPDLLRWVMEQYGSRWPVIHLGDGTNMACIGELDSFFEIMSSGGKPWVMVPGNHDMYLFGNTHVNKAEWDAACKRAVGPTTKDIFIRRYIEQLQKQFEEFRLKYPGEPPASGEWTTEKESKALLRSVAWHIDEKMPWRSYVVQQVDLSMPGRKQIVYAILLDSAQYEEAPNLFQNAGTAGDIRPDQLEVVRKWLQRDSKGESITLLMSHHPFGEIRKETGDRIDRFRQEYRIPLYVSGHTHQGQYYALGGSKGWLELNVGSITDWPIEFRTLTLSDMRDDPEKLVLVSRQFIIPDVWDKQMSGVPVCRPEWESRPKDEDYYLEYAKNSSSSPAQTQSDLMRSLLFAWERFLKAVPSAADNQVWPGNCRSDDAVLKEIQKAVQGHDPEPKIALLMELERFDKKRKAADPTLRRDYRVCQAICASKYEKQGSNWPIPSDPYIVFPRGR